MTSKERRPSVNPKLPEPQAGEPEEGWELAHQDLGEPCLPSGPTPGGRERAHAQRTRVPDSPGHHCLHPGQVCRQVKGRATGHNIRAHPCQGMRWVGPARTSSRREMASGWARGRLS